MIETGNPWLRSVSEKVSFHPTAGVETLDVSGNDHIPVSTPQHADHGRFAKKWSDQKAVSLANQRHRNIISATVN